MGLEDLVLFAGDLTLITFTCLIEQFSLGLEFSGSSAERILALSEQFLEKLNNFIDDVSSIFGRHLQLDSGNDVLSHASLGKLSEIKQYDEFIVKERGEQ